MENLTNSELNMMIDSLTVMQEYLSEDKQAENRKIIAKCYTALINLED